MPTEKNDGNRAPTPRTGRKLGDVVVRLPVLEKESITAPFDIVSPPPRMFQGEFGASWSVTCANRETGEKFVILMGGNGLRDQDMHAIGQALAASPAEPFGPVMLRSIKVKGRDTWELYDVEESES